MPAWAADIHTHELLTSAQITGKKMLISQQLFLACSFGLYEESGCVDASACVGVGASPPV